MIRGSVADGQMAVYLLLAPFLVYLLVAATVGGGFSFRGEDHTVTVAPVVKGMLAYLPALAVVWLVGFVLPHHYRPGWIYLYYLVTDYVVALAVSGALAYASLRSIRRYSDHALLVAATGFFGGFFLLAGLVDIVAQGRFLGEHLLFILPTNRAILVALVPLLALVTQREGTGTRYVYAAGIVVLPAILTIPVTVYESYYRLASYLITGVFAGLSVLVYLVVYVAYFRTSGGATGAGPGSTGASGGTQSGGTQSGGMHEENHEVSPNADVPPKTTVAGDQ